MLSSKIFTKQFYTYSIDNIFYHSKFYIIQYISFLIFTNNKQRVRSKYLDAFIPEINSNQLLRLTVYKAVWAIVTVLKSS